MTIGDSVMLHFRCTKISVCACMCVCFSRYSSGKNTASLQHLGMDQLISQLLPKEKIKVYKLVRWETG